MNLIAEMKFDAVRGPNLEGRIVSLAPQYELHAMNPYAWFI